MLNICFPTFKLSNNFYLRRYNLSHFFGKQMMKTTIKITPLSTFKSHIKEYSYNVSSSDFFYFNSLNLIDN